MKRSILLLALILSLAACQTPPTVEPTTEPQGGPRELVILYTNDEHGSMEADEDGTGGAAEMLGLWRQQEGYSEDGTFLVLSGGDMWTGPAISTWFDGESMTEVMNAMGYDAAAIGNHEFDFGLDGLRERGAQAEFPFLATNLRDRQTGEPAGVALPYVVQEVNGIQVGIIGLASANTPRTTNPDTVAGFEFAPYAEALAEVVPQARSNGAELLIVTSHLCSSEMKTLAPAAAELGIAVIGGGHCHESFNQIVAGVTLIESGSNMAGYVRVDMTFDTASDQVLAIKTQIHPNRNGEPDPEVAALIDGWRIQADEALDHVIGYLDKPIAQRSPAMVNMVTDAWLAAYPAADVALTNSGGFREGLAAGEITLADVVGVLPFNNVLVDVEITGEQLLENVTCRSCGTVMGGMTTRGGYQLADGTPIDPAATYHVLINDFMYAGGDGYRFQEYDPDPYMTNIDWRQPVIDWISAQKSTADNPLNQCLDTVARR